MWTGVRPGVRIHPVSYLGILTVVSIACGMTVLWILAAHPSVLGQAASYRLGAQALRFDDLQVQFQHLRILIPHGHIIPVIRTGEVSGALILGEGQYILGWDAPQEMNEATGHELLADTFPAMFSPIAYAQLENLRYRLAAEEVPADTFHPRAHAWLEFIAAPASLDFFGMPRRLYVEPSDVLVHIMGDAHGQIVYQERRGDLGILVTFTDLGGYRIELPSGEPKQLVLDSWRATVGASDFWALLVLMILLLVLLFCLIGILTVDLLGPDRPSYLGALSHGELVLLAVMMPVLLLMHLFVLPVQTAALVPPVAAWAIPLVLALLVSALSAGTATPREGLSTRARFFTGLGLRPLYPLRNLLLGIILGWLTFLVAYGAVPSFDQFVLVDGWWKYLLWAIFSWGLCQEMLYRGYFQTAIQRYLGARPGLIAAALLMGVMAALPLLLFQGYTVGQFMRQALVLSPLTALVSGYLLHRTGDIWAASISRGLYTFLLFSLIP